MNPATDNLDNASNTLNSCRLNLGKIKSPEISQWQKVNLDAYGSMLDSLELPAELKLTQKNLNTADTFSRKISSLGNEIKKLQAEINNQSVNQVRAESESFKILRECSELDRNITTLHKSCAKFIEADAIMRKGLTLKSMLPLAKFSTGSKDRIFDEGLRIFFLVADDREDSGDQPSVHEYFAEANQIAITLKSIDTSSLPGPVRQIISHHIDIAVTAVDDIKNFIDRHAHKFDQELASIKEIKQLIMALKKEPLKYMLDHTHEQIKPLGEQIMVFAAKSQFEKDFNLVPPLTKDLKIFSLALKHRLLEELGDRVTRPNSPLNPSNTSSTMAAGYFRGPKGIVRIIRLLLSTLLAGGHLISAEEIEEKLAELLASCPIYYGNNKDDINTLKNFIASVLEEYNKPFPYNGLFSLGKKALVVYGYQVEDFISTFPIEEHSSQSSAGRQQNISKKKSGGLATLTDRLKQRGEDLRKIR